MPVIRNAKTVTIQLPGGSSTTIPEATSGLAGLMTAADKQKLDLLVTGDIGGGGGGSDWFELIEDDPENPYLKTIYPLVSEKEITAYGTADVGGGGGGGATLFTALLDTPSSYANMSGMALVVDETAYGGSGGLVFVEPPTGGGDVESVNGQTGVVVLKTKDIEEDTNKYYTETRVSDNSDVSANSDHRVDTENPHGVTKTQVGLSDVPNLNTTDAVNNEHTHTNKSNLDTIDQDMAKTNSVTFAGLTVNGDINATGEVTAHYSSDKRLKKNIKEIQDGLNLINGLRPVKFKWNKKAVGINPFKNETTINLGLIAQEAKEIVPEVVHKNSNGYYMIDYVSLIPALIAAVKEQQQQILSLEKRLRKFEE